MATNPSFDVAGCVAVIRVPSSSGFDWYFILTTVYGDRIRIRGQERLDELLRNERLAVITHETLQGLRSGHASDVDSDSP